MRPQSARFLRTLLLFAFFSLLLPFSGVAQTSPAPSRITQAVDEANLTLLKGNTYYLARAKYDRGAAPSSLPMARMLLVLQRSPQQESALEQLLDQQQDQSSPNYHQWLTPQQFGQQFGPSDQDIQKVSSWLQSHGFQVAPISNGRTVIEFSGTAGQVQEAFHTSIHKYSVPTKAGALEDHWANSTDPSIPAALAPVVAGINTMHNFPRKPMHVVSGVFKKNRNTGETKPVNPEFSFTCGTNQNTNQPIICNGLGPFDFATIYNVLPLWNGSPAPVIDGTGQTIAIIGETDVDMKDIENFRSLFGLPANDPVVVLDGPDPGVVPGDETESDLDLEWSGAIAKGATIKFVTSATTNTTLGVDLSAQYAVDHNVAPVMSESYGICELGLGTAGNQFYNSVWQQAAAQGITAMVSAGDAGSAGCDSQDNPPPAPAEFGLQVSGFASTPYNVAVGGTDFNDLSNPTTYFRSTNNPTTQLSAKSYIPEVPWNDSCTSQALVFFGFPNNALENCNDQQLLNVNVFTVGGSGGKSACTTNDGQDVTSCSGGYAKPSWQTGTGVPSDGKRDIPDVSLFASAGFYTGSFYIVCEADQTSGVYCDQDPQAFDFLAVGGTSASSPAFAGIMALVNQKTASRQGNANYILYKLAAQSGASCTSSGTPASTCVFYDITTGTNAMPCDDTVPVPVNCGTAGPDGIGILTGYNSTAGYDLTTGLGSVNAANLVNKWTTITSALKPSTTTLSLNPTSAIVHGTPVTVQINVTPTAPATGTATGNVALLSTTAAAPPIVAGVTDFALTSGAVNSTTDVLPGGTYTVTAHYPGDGTFAASDSTPVPVTITSEGSKVAVTFLTRNTQGFPLPFTSGPYGSPVYLRADVSGNSGNGVPTGTVTFKDNGAAITGIAALTLNSQGNVLPTTPTFTFTAGTHPITGAYSGDPSFNASTSSAASFTITQVQTATSLAVSPTAQLGGPLNMIVNLTGTNCGNPPTGTVTFFSGSTQLGTPQIGQTATTPSDCSYNAQVIFTTSALPLGLNTVTAKFNGDTNYAAITSSPSTVDVQIPTAATITSSNLTVQHGTNVTFTAVVTPTKTGGPGPTGTVQFVSDQGLIGSPVPLTNGQAQISTSTIPGGVHEVTASYSGDNDYASSFDSLLQTVLVFPTTMSVTTSNAAITQGASVTLTAQVTSTHSGAPGLTGTVQFSSAITAQGSNSPVGAAVTVTNGQAQLTTTSIPAGTQLILALYSGDPNYATSNASTAEVVTAAPDFNIAFAPATVNVSSPGASASTTVTITGSNGYNGAINFSSASCSSGLPSETSCSFSPATITGSGTTMLTVSTTAPSSLVPLSRRIDFGGWRTTAGAIRILILCSVLLALAIHARRRRWNLASATLMFTLLIGIAACGGSGGGSSGGGGTGGGGGGTGPTNPGTPVVTNQVITVTATSGSITHSFTFTLDVN
jgi:Pro-kumamolisin, activation domain/Bacterial Ig-like domain (group 3)